MSDTNYDLKTAAAATVTAPDLPYRPPVPRGYRPKLGLIGCGGIVDHHLKAAQALGVEVVCFCDPRMESAQKRRDAYFPGAAVTTDPAEVFARADIDVVDIATHPKERVALIEAALQAGKHVLSQKPFVLDLETGRRLADLADAKGLKLAINQNGRWAPYFSYLLKAVKAGVLGELQSLELTMAWDHTWVKGTAFEKIPHLVLYDFAIHWFDIAANVFEGRKALKVFATAVPARGQDIAPPLLANASVVFEGGLATLAFSAHAKHGAEERFIAVGSRGTLKGTGPLCGIPKLTLATEAGEAEVTLEGSWFPDGFKGSLGELLCAIEDGRAPFNNARDNLRSLEICFAALKSADTGQVVAL
jgi:predicted dehydrogenase